MSTQARSFGIIPVLKTDDGCRFLLIHMYGSGGGTHWSFPKGHAEPGESPEETARRETKEEVGIVDIDVYTGHTFTHSYHFLLDGEHIEKEVQYFIGFVKDDAITLQAEEVKEAEWLSAEDTLVRITYETNKALFREVLCYLSAANIDK